MLRAPPETVDIGLGLWMASLARQLRKLGPFLAKILAQTQVENNPCLIKGNLLGTPKGRSRLPLFTAWFANSAHRRREGGRWGHSEKEGRVRGSDGQARAGARTLGDEWDELDGLPPRGLLCQRVPHSPRPGSPRRRGSWGRHRRRTRHTGGDGALQHRDRPSSRFCVVLVTRDARDTAFWTVEATVIFLLDYAPGFPFPLSTSVAGQPGVGAKASD